MPRRRLCLALALLCATGAAFAQPLADGEVRKIDTAHGKLTLRHGELKNVQLPAMTMAYRVRDPAMLAGLAEGSHVRFAVDKIDGQFTITRLEKTGR